MVFKSDKQRKKVMRELNPSCGKKKKVDIDDIVDFNSFDNDINEIRNEVKECTNRHEVNDVIKRIHELRYKIEDLEYKNKITYEDAKDRLKKLRNSESKVCEIGLSFH